MAGIYISNDPSGRIIVFKKSIGAFQKSDGMLEKMRERRVISKENGRGNPASARSENVRNSSSIPPNFGSVSEPYFGCERVIRNSAVSIKKLDTNS